MSRRRAQALTGGPSPVSPGARRAVRRVRLPLSQCSPASRTGDRARHTAHHHVQIRDGEGGQGASPLGERSTIVGATSAHATSAFLPMPRVWLLCSPVLAPSSPNFPARHMCCLTFMPFNSVPPDRRRTPGPLGSVQRSRPGPRTGGSDHTLLESRRMVGSQPRTVGRLTGCIAEAAIYPVAFSDPNVAGESCCAAVES